MSMPNYPKNNIGRELIPLKVINQTGLSNLYIYVTGTTQPKNPEHNTYVLSDLNGNVTLCTPTRSAVSYSLPIADSQTLQLPRLSAMRFYFSLGQPLQVIVGDNGIPDAPAGWVKDMNYNTVFDWVEMTWEVNSSTDMTLGGNTTQVDMFGIPFSLQLTGYDPNGKPITLQSGFTSGGVRNNIINRIKNSPVPWNQLVCTDDKGFNTRVLCPYHCMPPEMDIFPDDQLDDYIDQVWAYYATNPILASAEGMDLVGKTVQGNFVFTSTSNNEVIAVFPKPTTRDVYLTGPQYKPVIDDLKKKAEILQAALQAGFMRSTLLSNPDKPTLPDCTSAFYQNDPINWYAKILHQYASNNEAYAFGYDDVCSNSSFIEVHNPESAQVTLLLL